MTAKIRQNKDKDASFRAALVHHGEFKYGLTVVGGLGSVEIVQEYRPFAASFRQELVVRIISDQVSQSAYSGLKVVPVEDESGHQLAQTMDITGEVNFPLWVHSVRFVDE